MAIFRYQARKNGGETVTGEMNATTRSEALAAIEKKGLFPIRVTAADAATLLTAGNKSGDVSLPEGELKLSRSQLLMFTDEVSDLLEAGMQLEPALRIMEQREEKSSLKYIGKALRQKVREGVSFSNALKSTSKSFDELYCNLAAAGELSGALPEILRRQARYLTAMHELQSRVIQSLLYPAFLSVAGIVLIFIFMTQLVPRLTSLFSKTGKNMPFVTQVLIQTSEFLSQTWWMMLIGVMIGGIAFSQVIRTPEGKRWWHKAQLKLPLVGPILVARFYAQMTQTLSTLLINGIPLLNALKLMRNATSNVHLQNLMEKITERVSEGGTLTRAMKRAEEFPSVLLDMIAVGEQTGDLGKALEKIAARYDKELNKRIQRLTALIQPVIISIMALVVGVVAYSMITGIFQAVSGLRGK